MRFSINRSLHKFVIVARFVRRPLFSERIHPNGSALSPGTSLAFCDRIESDIATLDRARLAAAGDGSTGSSYPVRIVGHHELIIE